MSDRGATAGLIGAAAAIAATVAPKVWDKVTGGKAEARDGASILADGASDVTVAAMALIQQHDADAHTAREAEAQCRRHLAEVRAELERVNTRIDQIHDDNTGRPEPPSSLP